MAQWDPRYNPPPSARQTAQPTSDVHQERENCQERFQYPVDAEACLRTGGDMLEAKDGHSKQLCCHW